MVRTGGGENALIFAREIRPMPEHIKPMLERYDLSVMAGLTSNLEVDLLSRHLLCLVTAGPIQTAASHEKSLTKT